MTKPSLKLFLCLPAALLLLSGCNKGDSVPTATSTPTSSKISSTGYTPASVTPTSKADSITPEIEMEYYYDFACAKKLETNNAGEISGLVANRTFYCQLIFSSFESTFASQKNVSFRLRISNVHGFTFEKTGIDKNNTDVIIDNEINNNTGLEIRNINFVVDPGATKQEVKYLFGVSSSTGIPDGQKQNITVNIIYNYDSQDHDFGSKSYVFNGSAVSPLLMQLQDVSLNKKTGVLNWKAVSGADHYWYKDESGKATPRDPDENYYPIDRKAYEGLEKKIELWASCDSIEHGDSDHLSLALSVLARPTFTISKTCDESYVESFSLVFDPVARAEEYVLKVNNSELPHITASGAYDFAKLFASYSPGVQSLTMYATSSQDYVIDSLETGVKDFRVLAAPNINLSNRTLSWNRVDGADTYLVYSDGVFMKAINTLSYTISSSAIPFGSKLTVRAFNADNYTLESLASNTITSDVA
jgi:hypothetical protein